MGVEIERKFLVNDHFCNEVESSQRIVQGYICSLSGRTVRVRIRGNKGFLTIKGPSDNQGLTRAEFEYEIPEKDAEAMMSLCESGVIDKVRNLIHYGNHLWEVDVFHGDNEGLIVAEVELGSENEPFERPSWLGKEVTGDRRYYNSMLIHHPYKEWED